jgi:arylsulfatase A-like enzyme
VLAADVLFYGGGLVLWSALIGSARPRLRRAAVALLHIAAPALVDLHVVELAYFRASGALADWYLLKDAIRGFAHLTRLYRGELSPVRVAMLAAPWLWSAGVLVIGRRRTGAFARPLRPARLLPVGTGAVLVAAGLGLAEVPPALGPLRRPVLGGMLVDALADTRRLLASPAVSTSAEDARMIGPMALEALGTATARNAVVIALESTGAGATSLYGGPHDTTPFLRELGARGAVVERAYTTVPHTSKALVSLFCGVMPKPQTGVDEAEADAIPARCLPALLREHGFATAFFQPAEENFERRADLVRELGFESFVGKESLDGAGFDESSYFGWEDAALARPIEAWLDAHGNQPFLLAALTLASHHPYALPRGAAFRKFADAPALNDYLNTIAYTDRFLRALFQAFERRGLMRDTVFVVVGDHGEAFGQHGRHQHDAVPYEEGLRVPMVLAGPSIAPGRRVPGLRQLIDVAPTLAGQLGFRATPSFSGKDLLSTLGHERIWAACYLREYCLAEIDGWSKVVHHFDRQPDQLFDLRDDPGETRDLAGDGSYIRVTRAVARAKSARNATLALYEGRASLRLRSFVTKTPPAPLLAPGSAGAVFEDFAELIGFDVQPRAATAGGVVTITSVFHVTRRPDPAWELFMHLTGPRTVNADHVPVQGAHPVSRWDAGEYVVDRHRVALRPATEPERFEVQLGFWRRDSKARAAAGAADFADLGAIDVRPPPANRADFVGADAPAATGVDISFGRSLRLLGAVADRKIVKAGLPLTVTYFFRALVPLGPELELHAELLGPTARETAHVPVGGAVPLSTLAPGQVLRDPHAIVTLTADPPGSYRVVLVLFDRARGRRVPPAGRGLPIVDGGVEVARFEVTP